MNNEILEAIIDIRKRVRDFDFTLVVGFLKNLNHTQPAKAVELNNPVGWEEIWYLIKV